MSEEEIFCMLVKDLLRLVQTFCFEEMTSAIKARLIVVEDCANSFWLLSLNVHILYKKEEAPALPTSPNRSSSNLSILEPNNCVCDEFVSMAVKNKARYTVIGEVKEMHYNYGLAHDTVVLMVDQEFLLIGYRLDTLCPPLLKPNVADAIGVCYGRLPLKAKTKFHIDQV